MRLLLLTLDSFAFASWRRTKISRPKKNKQKKSHSHFNLTVSQVEDMKICPAEHINKLKENNQEYKQ